MGHKNKKITFRAFLCLLSSFILILFFQNCGKEYRVSVVGTQEQNSEDDDAEADSSAPTTPSMPTSPQCTTGFHLENQTCVSNTRSCSITNGIGQQTWNGTVFGACQVVSCSNNYSNQSNVCVFSPSSCSIANGNGQTQADGACRLVSCNSGFHVIENRCASNIRFCTVSNGNGMETWTGTAYGPCVMQSCNPTFHAESGNCVSDTVPCIVPNGSGFSTWNGTSYGSCVIAACAVGHMSNGTACVPIGATSPVWSAKSSARIFISGHSLTDDPFTTYLGDIATKSGDSYNYNQQIVIGSPMRVRTRGGGTTGWSGYSSGKNRNGTTGLNIINELRNPQTIGTGARYDNLVVAENHNSLGMIQWEDTIGYLRHYHDRLIEGNSTARTFFYNTWLGLNKASPTPWIDHEKKATVAWECVASKVNHSLQSAGRTDRVLNLPASAALVDLVEKIIANQVTGISGSSTQKLNMIFSDDVHLTPLGIYYMSLVTYASVYGKSPSGLTPPSSSGISASLAAQLQTIAWDFINSYYSRVNPGVRDMAYCRSYIDQQVCSSFWTLKGDTGQITSCRNFFNGSNSPFRWPDASFVPYPAP